MKQLNCMDGHCDGAHCGLSDWYPEIEQGIAYALAAEGDWTTGWYSSKKEIASAQITRKADRLRVAVSVSDDFDTSGYGDVEVYPAPTNIEAVRKMVSTAWNLAEENRKENRDYAGFSVHRGDAKGPWVETFLVDMSGSLDKPPGDNYFQWGFQDDETDEIPDHVKEQLAEWAHTNVWDDGVALPSFSCEGWTIARWSDD